ncbi:hypothetical protein IW22_18215 [Chryseobacterium sp. JM1]|nr:hypothetical protein IW22_18215 [Chryseobacterium sp. JM1]
MPIDSLFATLKFYILKINLCVKKSIVFQIKISSVYMNVFFIFFTHADLTNKADRSLNIKNLCNQYNLREILNHLFPIRFIRINEIDSLFVPLKFYILKINLCVKKNVFQGF